MAVILYSKVGDFVAHIKEIPNNQDDKFSFLFIEKNRKYTSEGSAIRNARIFLKKKRASFVPPPVRKKKKRLGLTAKEKEMQQQAQPKKRKRMKPAPIKQKWVQVRLYEL